MKFLLLLFMLALPCGLLAQITIGGNPPDGENGESYSYTFSASGGTGPYTYSINQAPDLLSLNSSTGELSGNLMMPVMGDTYTFTITATDSTSVQGSKQFSISVDSGGGGNNSGNDGPGGGCAVGGTSVAWLLLPLLIFCSRRRARA